jgi:D-alanyl-D-alanine carboxypeptidase
LRLLVSIAALCLLLPILPAAAQSPAFIIVDADADMVLGARDSDKPWYPASVTKLMTAYLVFDALKRGQLKLTSPVVMSAKALAEPPSKMGFKVGTVINVDNALKMMLVHSSNDIAVAFSETVGGSEQRFVAAMNAQARRLGMNSTNYNNPNGLPDGGQITTARDLAVLARALWIDFPEYRSYFRIPAIKAGRRILRSQNALLERYRGSNGMKTGFICDSGFNMVASATRSGRTLITVVLGATSAASRAETAAKLLNQGFAGGSFGFPRTGLASFRSGASAGLPVNMRDEVCGRRRKPPDEDAEIGFGSGLDPRFQVMDPVVVVTGQTDPDPNASRGAVAAKVDPPAVPPGGEVAVVVKAGTAVPLPRLRPQFRVSGGSPVLPAKTLKVKAGVSSDKIAAAKRLLQKKLADTKKLVQ